MAQVVAHKDEIEQLKAQVVTVSFGTLYWSKVWLQETGSPFPFLVDKEKQAYQAYGLASSAIRSWGVRNLWYYAKAKWQGRELLGNRGDTHQLGGDFVVDSAGIIRLACPSRDPTDRPSIEEILKVLEGM